MKKKMLALLLTVLMFLPLRHVPTQQKTPSLTAKLPSSLTRLKKMMGEAARLLWNESPWNNNNTVGYPAHPIFKAGKLTFLSEYLGQFRKLRDNDDLYSIIVWPTPEENMDAKIHLRNPTGLAILSDNSSKDVDTLSTILNALAAYSYDYILEDYIKYAVVAKSSRDAESAEVVRYALYNTAYDISAALGLGAHHWWNEACQENTYASTERAHIY